MDNSAKYCRFCGRLLKSKASIERGFGLTCYKKYLKSVNGGLFQQFNNAKQNSK